MCVPESVWRHAPAILPLKDEEVHVWCAALDQPAPRVEAFEKLLADDERTRSQQFRFRKDRVHYIVGRGILRTILGRYLNRDPGTLQFGYTLYKKPGLIHESEGDANLSFNVTHAGGIALYAVTRNRSVGIDLEGIRLDVDYDSLAEHFFSPREIRMLQAVPSAKRLEAFFRCWTRKEAYLKARGIGLSLPLDQFDVSVSPNEPAALLETREEGQDASRWSLFDLPVAGGYVAALAGEGEFRLLFCQ
jgi:4'-phosphopantetheinyl transferase